jgi:hypothetical protein
VRSGARRRPAALASGARAGDGAGPASFPGPGAAALSAPRLAEGPNGEPRWGAVGWERWGSVGWAELPWSQVGPSADRRKRGKNADSRPCTSCQGRRRPITVAPGGGRGGCGTVECRLGGVGSARQARSRRRHPWVPDPLSDPRAPVHESVRSVQRARVVESPKGERPLVDRGSPAESRHGERWGRVGVLRRRARRAREGRELDRA